MLLDRLWDRLDMRLSSPLRTTLRKDSRCQRWRTKPTPVECCSSSGMDSRCSSQPTSRLAWPSMIRNEAVLRCTPGLPRCGTMASAMHQCRTQRPVRACLCCICVRDWRDRLLSSSTLTSSIHNGISSASATGYLVVWVETSSARLPGFAGSSAR